MRRIVPNYYNDFRCIGGACRHNCCIGWEIGIDDETAEIYAHTQGELGERLQKAMKRGDDGCSFTLCEDGRCPFLNGDRLCDIILEMGEENLSQICSDHPRFRADYADVTEVGLGLVCEEAARLILMQREPVTFLEFPEGGEEIPLTDREAAVIAARDALIAAAQDRTRTIRARMTEIARRVGLDGIDLTSENWIGFFQDLEKMEDTSDENLARLMTGICDGVVPRTEEAPRAFEIPGEQALVYFLYRYLAHSEDAEDFRARVGFALLGTGMLLDLWRLFVTETDPRDREQTLVEHARRFSQEVEYSEENVERILHALRLEIRDRDRAAISSLSARKR